MNPTPKIIKSSKFEDGTFTIKAPVHPLPMIEGEDGTLAPYVDPQRAAAEQETRELLLRARAEVESTLAEAEEALAAREAELMERVEQERQRILDEARQEGYGLGLAEGREAGQQMVMDEHADVLAQLHGATEMAAAERSLWFEAQQKDVVKLAILIAQKILLMELATSRESVVKMAEAALKHVTDKTHVRIRVHPGDMARLNAARQQLTLAVDNLTSLELVGDPEVGVGGCMIDTRTGMVDARLATQLAEVAAALLDIAPGPDGAGDLDPMVLAAVRALGQGGHVLAAAPSQAPQWQRPAAPTQPKPAAPVPAPAAPAPVQPAPAPAVLPSPQPVFEAPAPVHAPIAMGSQADALRAAAAQLAPDPVVVPAAPVLEPPVAVYAPSAPPEATYQVPAEEPAPAPHQPAATPRSHVVDPSRRAADALAARLGQLKKGRGVVTLSEEYDLTKLAGALPDQDLEHIVKQTTRNVVDTEIGTDQVLVHNPFALEDAADALAERLGKKKAPRRIDESKLGDVLGDTKIDEIMGTLMPRVGEEAAPADQPEQASIDKASENLAKLLGKTKRKSNRPWYEQ